MATGKKYFWIKLKDSFLTSDTVDYFMGLKDGANYVVLYQMLLLKTINTNGRFSRQIGEVIIPYDVEKIQRDCKYFSIDTIRIALKMYRAFGLIYEDTDGTLVMTSHDELVGSETDFAKQKRAQRVLSVDKGKDSSVDSSVDNGVDNVHIDIRDKRLDIDIDSSSKRFKHPTLEDVKEYVSERGNKIDPDKFFNYYEANGWKVGRNPMKDWQAAVRSWESKEQKQASSGNKFHNFEQRKDNLDADVMDKFLEQMEDHNES